MSQLTDTQFNKLNMEDKRVGYVTFTCNDPYCLRVAMEIMSCLTLKGGFRFLDGGFYISHHNVHKTASASFFVTKVQLLTYDLVLPDNAEQEDNSSLCAHVNLSKFVEICKSYTKKDSLTMSADILEGYRVETIICQKNGANADKINCDGDDQGEQPIDMLDVYYHGCEATFKMAVSNFSSIFDGFRTRRCSSVVFTLQKNMVLITGYKDNMLISGSEIYLPVDAHVEPVDEPETDVEDPGIDAAQIAAQEEHSIKINYNNCSSWITKISRLSNANSVISFFIQDGAPLVIRANLGTMGWAVFAFTERANK